MVCVTLDKLCSGKKRDTRKPRIIAFHLWQNEYFNKYKDDVTILNDLKGDPDNIYQFCIKQVISGALCLIVVFFFYLN